MELGDAEHRAEGDGAGGRRGREPQDEERDDRVEGRVRDVEGADREEDEPPLASGGRGEAAFALAFAARGQGRVRDAREDVRVARPEARRAAEDDGGPEKEKKGP